MRILFYGISLALIGILVGAASYERRSGTAAVQVVDKEFDRQKVNWQNFKDQLAYLNDMAVREPSRPLLHYREEILKLHYLWLEVRDYKFVQYEKHKRAQLDAYVARLVADVEKDKRLEEVISGL
jgi:hypothetical protein